VASVGPTLFFQITDGPDSFIELLFQGVDLSLKGADRFVQSPRFGAGQGDLLIVSLGFVDLSPELVQGFGVAIKLGSNSFTGIDGS